MSRLHAAPPSPPTSAAALVEAFVETTLAAAPPLTDAQAERLASLLPDVEEVQA